MGYHVFVVTIYRAHGLRVVIFVDDHEPAHVHVFGDGQVRINLVGAAGGPELIWAEIRKRSDVRRAMKIVIERRDHFWPDGGKSMVDRTDAQIDAAMEREGPPGKLNLGPLLLDMTGSLVASSST